MCVHCSNLITGFGEDAVQSDPGFQHDGLWQTLVGAGVAPPVVELFLDRLTGEASGGGEAEWLFGGEDGPAAAGVAATGGDGDDAGAGEIAIPDAPADGDGESAPQAPAWQADLFGGAEGDPGAGVELGEIPNSVATTVEIQVGSGWVSSQIEVSGDEDWIRVELEAGKTYSIRMNGSGQTPLFDPRIYLLDSIGSVLDSNDDADDGFDGQPSQFGNANRGAHLLYTATQTGTYYIDANAFSSFTGGYTVLVDEVPAAGSTPGIPSTSLMWGGRTFDNTISVYFAGAGEVYDGRTSLGWQQWQIDQTMAALQTFSGFTNLTFTLTNTAAGSDFQMITVNDSSLSASAYFNPPGEANAGVGVWNLSSSSYLFESYSNQWNVGSGAWHTIIHEFGHAFGLSHTHDRGGLSNVMNGVSSSNGDYGDFNLNQGPFTMMGYNYSYATGANGASGDTSVGFNVNAGTLDVAILQRLYGANETANGGDDVYLLTDTAGGFVTIWDTGGVDEIRYNGSGTVLIALQAATLDYANNGGGIVSEVAGVQGGFVIAAGSEIENATGGSGTDILYGNELDNVLEGREGQDLVLGNGGNDRIVADAIFDDDTYDGGDDVDTFDVSAWTWVVTVTIDLTAGTWSFGSFSEQVLNFENVFGADQDGTFVETITGNALANALYGNGGNDVLNGMDGMDKLYGGSGIDELFGGAGIDILDGGVGADMMAGGADNDFYFVDNLGDVVDESLAGSSGIDIVYSTVSVDFQDSARFKGNVERAILQGSGNLNAFGNGLSNLLVGTSGVNTLDGRGGADVMRGLGGNDFYYVDDFGDLVDEGAAGSSGIDIVLSSISVDLEDAMRFKGAIERVILQGSGNQNAFGNSLDNLLVGTSGSNTLDGRGGADVMRGLGGNDFYFIDSVADVVDESFAGSSGIDIVYSTVSVDLADGTRFKGDVERAILQGGGNQNVLGNALDNLLVGTSGSNALDGRAGADVMRGLGGNDYYFVDNVGDVVDESFAGSSGIDVVRATVSVDLADGARFKGDVERVILLGNGNQNALGNGLDNLLIGNSGSNALDGRAGADTMRGLGGNDFYFVDDLADVVDESAAGSSGIDTVQSSVGVNLADGARFKGDVERVVLLGNDDLAAVGNGLANVLIGNSGKNFLNGGANADTMRGLGGDDTYTIDDLGDVVDELAAGSNGNDTVRSTVSVNLTDTNRFKGNIENAVVFGTTALNLVGNDLANTLTGNNGSNAINGREGNDILSGLGGADTFVFNTTLNAATNVDDILDFEVGVDTILLASSIFAGLSTGGLAPSAFTIGAAATQAAQRIVYNDVTGDLFFDADGSGIGGQTLFANLTAGLALTQDDFFVV